MAQEVRGALYGLADKPTIKNYIVGLGGKDMTPDLIEKIYLKTLAMNGKLDQEIEWIGVKGHGGW
jgi:pyruvate/2-oxoacid:ferredoxin oxidoreductase alpha subunit